MIAVFAMSITGRRNTRRSVGLCTFTKAIPSLAKRSVWCWLAQIEPNRFSIWLQHVNGTAAICLPDATSNFRHATFKDRFAVSAHRWSWQVHRCAFQPPGSERTELKNQCVPWYHGLWIEWCKRPFGSLKIFMDHLDFDHGISLVPARSLT